MQLVPALSSGGVERSTLEIAQALVSAGHQSVVVSAGGRLVASLQQHGSRHVTLDIGRKSLSTLRHVITLRRLFAQERPDIVHARSRLPAWLAWLAMRTLAGARPRFVTSVHGLNSAGWYSSILTRGERVICVSDTVRDHVLRFWPGAPRERISVVEPGIDPKVFSAGVASPDALDRLPVPAALGGRKLLLMPGRGTRLKGHAAAIELLSDLRAAGVDAGLWLLGSTQAGREAYLAELTALAAARDVSGFLAMSPPHAEVVQAYRHADVVLQLSSHPEAYGRTVVESLSVGTPVVGWDHGGVGELLGRHFPEGRVPLGNQAALLATTLRVLAESRRPPAIHAPTLSDAQARTLKVYESLAG